MDRKLLTIICLCLMMSVSSSSQNLSVGKTVVISLAEMDSISVKLIRLGQLEMYTSLMEVQVEDLRLLKRKQDTIIFNLKATISNQEGIIADFEQIIMEYETIMGAEQAACKIEKKRIRKRLLLIGGSGTATGLIVGLVLGLISN